MLASFKTKVLKNTLIYYIYRYYKYKFKYFSSYSAHGEDVFIKKFFKMLKGFFVDVGALHPINGSLTYNLYLNGWRGINIDMIKENLMLFNIFRKGDTNLNSQCFVKKRINRCLFFYEQGSGVNTNSQKWADMWSKKFKKVYKKREESKKMLRQYSVVI